MTIARINITPLDGSGTTLSGVTVIETSPLAEG